MSTTVGTLDQQKKPPMSTTSVTIDVAVQVTPVTNGLSWQMTHDNYTINNGWIWVGANVATINFNLTLNNAPANSSALFASPGAQWWIDGALSSTPPDMITVAGNGTATLTFTDYDFATTEGGNPHKFFLVVNYTPPPGGTTTTYYSPDPTIINKEPPTSSL